MFLRHGVVGLCLRELFVLMSGDASCDILQLILMFIVRFILCLY